MEEKATLKAELAFAYEAKNCSAQKVVYLEVEFALYLNKQGGKKEKRKISCWTLPESSPKW